MFFLESLGYAHMMCFYSAETNNILVKQKLESSVDPNKSGEQAVLRLTIGRNIND